MKILKYLTLAFLLPTMFSSCDKDDIEENDDIICTYDSEITGEYELAVLDKKDSLIFFVDYNNTGDVVRRIDVIKDSEIVSYSFDEDGRPESIASYDKSFIMCFGNYKEATFDITVTDGEEIYLYDNIEYTPDGSRTRGHSHGQPSSDEDDKFFKTSSDGWNYAWSVVSNCLSSFYAAYKHKMNDAILDFVMAHLRVVEPAINSKGYTRILDNIEFASALAGYLEVAGTLTAGSGLAWGIAMAEAYPAGEALGEIVAGLQIGITERINNLKAMLKGGHGKLKVTLSWGFYADIDVHAYEPNGTHIYYGHKTSSVTGGYLDIDNRNGGPGAVENIYWENPEDGVYEFYLNHYSGSQCGNCNVTVTYNGRGTPFNIYMNEDAWEIVNRMVVNNSTRAISTVDNSRVVMKVFIPSEKSDSTDEPKVVFENK